MFNLLSRNNSVRLIFFILNISSAFAADTVTTDTDRGEMLYNNHCIQCHNEQVYWRDKKLATDSKSLIDQVNRWQHSAGLEWSKTDISEVTRYLNNKYYRYP